MKYLFFYYLANVACFFSQYMTYVTIALDIAMRFAENIGMKLETYHSAHHICTHYVDIMSKHFIQTWSGIEISGKKRTF